MRAIVHRTAVSRELSNTSPFALRSYIITHAIAPPSIRSNACTVHPPCIGKFSNLVIQFLLYTNSYSCIFPGVVHQDARTARMPRQPFRDVVHLSVQYDPAVRVFLVLRDLLSRVDGQRVFLYLGRRHNL